MESSSKSRFADLELSDAVELDRLCDEFETRWRLGATPRIADYIARANPSISSSLLRELLRIDRGYRFPEGGSAAIEHYLDEFAEQADIVRSVLLHATEQSSQSDAIETTVAQPEPRGSDGVESPASRESELLGRQLGQYRIVGMLGQGGMGTVYRAEHTLIRREVALKILRPKLAANPNAVRRFLIEAEASLKLKHPNVVEVTDVNVDHSDGTIFITMELIDGPNLTEFVKEKGPLPAMEAARIIRDVAQALALAASRSPPIIHRDIKPQNIMLNSEGQAKLLDLGLVRVIDEEDSSVRTGEIEHSSIDPSSHSMARLTQSGAVLGTPAYMAPEQIRDPRQTDIRSDIYALGGTFCYLLAGRHFHEGFSTAETIDRVLNGVRPDLAEVVHEDLPSSIVQIIEKMTAFDPSQRYQAADELLADLNSVLGTANSRDMDVRRLTMPELRDKLILLDLIRSEDWDRLFSRKPAGDFKNTVYQTLAMSPSDSWADSSNRTMQFATPNVDNPVEALLKLQSPRGGSLTEYQVQAILAGKMERLRLGDRIIEKPLGHSWRGEVFLARNPSAGRRREVVRTFGMQVLEGLYHDPQLRQTEFLQIAQAYGDVEHPNLAKTYGIGVTPDGIGFWATEFVEGTSLADGAEVRSKKLGRSYSEAETVRRGLQLVEAIAALHAVGLAHLDVSPWTVRVSQGESKLVGAGVRRLLSPCQGRAATDSTGVILGSPGTMAPEQWLDPESVGLAADLFSVGAVLYYAIVGEFPYIRTTEQGDRPIEAIRKTLAMARVGDAMVGAQNVKHLRPLITRLIEPDQGRRPASIIEVRDELASLAARIESGSESRPDPRFAFRRVRQRKETAQKEPTGPGDGGDSEHGSEVRTRRWWEFWKQ